MVVEVVRVGGPRVQSWATAVEVMVMPAVELVDDQGKTISSAEVGEKVAVEEDLVRWGKIHGGGMRQRETEAVRRQKLADEERVEIEHVRFKTHTSLTLALPAAKEIFFSSQFEIHPLPLPLTDLRRRLHLQPRSASALKSSFLPLPPASAGPPLASAVETLCPILLSVSIN
ncbi:RING/U-box superfamily protein [Striga asiatica]|uniref:RING/U-box superfamily protein n=1 Tax=Striga asiatica TaxID=4170 RepID=A0A5A7Q9W1_STRAF|nr:RING/U-box superfamily protein [Striga asiatica]